MTITVNELRKLAKDTCNEKLRYISNALNRAADEIERCDKRLENTVIVSRAHFDILAASTAKLKELEGQKPVAYRDYYTVEGFPNNRIYRYFDGFCLDCEPLYARPVPAVPEGYILAPKEPTAGMVKAMKDAWRNRESAYTMRTTDAYRVFFAAIAAAPKEPTK